MYRLKNSLVLASVSVLALAISGSCAFAQTITLPQVPLSDADCPINSFPTIPPCITTGTRTSTPTSIVVTPGTVAGTSNINASSSVTYNGDLAIDGTSVTITSGPGGPVFSLFNLDASNVFNWVSAKVNVTSSYDGSTSITGIPNPDVPLIVNGFSGGAVAQFQNYNFMSNTINSINVSVADMVATDQTTGLQYLYYLSTPTPTVLTGGNSAALSGRFMNYGAGTITFGKLTGNATVLTASPNSQVLSPTDLILDPNGNPIGGWISPYALQSNVTAAVTTQLDENGLVTPVIAVTDGINMNGSAITNLGAGVNATDAVNKGQLDTVATTATGAATAATAAQTTANTALANAATAQTAAGAAQTTANAAQTAAAGAQTTANTALANAATAQTAASTAQTTANTALASAATAQTTATTAITTANSANTTANAAQATANAIDAKATNALTIATQTAALVNTGANGDQVSLGAGCQVVSGKAVCVGTDNKATGNGAVAIGDPNIATGQGAVAIGADNTATGQGAVALGNLSVANGQSAVALGDKANAVGASAVAVGQSAQATFANSAAVGSGAATSRANQVKLGGAASSVTVGDVAASTAAQVGPTDVMTVDASGTVGRDTTIRPAIVSIQATQVSQASSLAAMQAFTTAAGSRLAALEAGQANLFNLVDHNRKQANKGIAAVAAMSPAHFPSEPGKTSYSVNSGIYRGEVAFSLSFAHRFDGDTPFALTAGVSNAGKGNTAGRVGVAGEF